MFVINSLIFILIVFSYYFVLKTILDAPFYPLGLLIGFWYAFRKKQATPKALASITRLETLFVTIFSLVSVGLFHYFDIWTLSWLRLWESPILLGISLPISIFQASKSSSDNPVLRGLASFTSLSAWPIFILVFIGIFSPQLIGITTFKWGVTLSGVLLFLVMILSIKRNPQQVELFEGLGLRHKLLVESLDKLQQMANLIGDTESWRNIREAINDVNKWTSLAHDALRKGKYQDSEVYMIQAETETTHIKRTFNDRIRLSLRDELDARLRQAKIDISNLENEFVSAGYDPKNIKNLSNKVDELTHKLDEMPEFEEDVLEQLKPYEDLFREIIDTRTALRFGRNIGSTIDILEDDLSDGSLTILVAQDLGLATSKAQTVKEQLLAMVTNFKTGLTKASENLVEEYNRIQKDVTSYQTEIALLRANIADGWIIKQLDGATIYIPKKVTTTEASRGLVIVATEKLELEKGSFSISGTLLELPSEKVIDLPKTKDVNLIRHFSFAGKKGGRAILTIKFEKISGLEHPTSFDVKVKQTITENAQSALLFGTPIGGVSVLILWLTGLGIDVAAPLGAAIGGVFGLFIFIINLFVYRK